MAAQLRALRDHAEKNGHAVVREYVDGAESGWVDDRPQFNKMIEEARSPDAAFREILIRRTQQQRKTQVLVGSRLGSIQAKPDQVDNNPLGDG